MAVRLDELDELETRAGADEDAIRVVEESLGRKLPSEYRAFLLASDGAFGFLGEEAYVNLWRVEELLELNAGYEVELGWPGLTLFGTNGGADGFGFVWEDGRVQYICVPLIGFEEEYAVKSEHLLALLLGTRRRDESGGPHSQATAHSPGADSCVLRPGGGPLEATRLHRAILEQRVDPLGGAAARRRHERGWSPCLRF